MKSRSSFYWRIVSSNSSFSLSFFNLIRPPRHRYERACLHQLPEAVGSRHQDPDASDAQDPAGERTERSSRRPHRGRPQAAASARQGHFRVEESSEATR